MNQKNKKWLIFSVVFVLLSFNSFFIVHQQEQAVILQFGKFQKKHNEPGIKFKLPFIQEVLYYDNRVLGYDVAPVSLTTADQKRLMVDVYARYRISDPLLFYKTIVPANEQGANVRLDTIVGSAVRNVLGTVALEKLLSTERSVIMKKITKEVEKKIKPLGLTIIDVRIIRTELPTNNRSAVFSRMNAQLISYAKENRAIGEQEAQTIRAEAEKKVTILLAKANKDSAVLLAQSQKKAATIATKAFERDPEFYEVYRYFGVSDVLQGKNSELMITTNGIFGKTIEKMIDYEEHKKEKNPTSSEKN
jgi:membrane protease subunit HflC